MGSGDLDPIPEGEEGGEEDEPDEAQPPLTIDARVKDLLYKVHVNLGHPRLPLFIRVLRGAHVRPE
eukprot:6069044-Pyramimonas_sp.AAC.1